MVTVVFEFSERFATPDVDRVFKGPGSLLISVVNGLIGTLWRAFRCDHFTACVFLMFCVLNGWPERCAVWFADSLSRVFLDGVFRRFRMLRIHVTLSTSGRLLRGS